MDSGNGKQVVGYDPLNMQLDPQPVDQSNIGCPSQMQASLGYNSGPVHHTDKQYLNQDMSYSLVPRMQLRDQGNHGMMTVRPTQKNYSVDNYGNNSTSTVRNTSPSRGRVVSQMHYIREDNASVNVNTTLSLQHQQQNREDNNTVIYMGTSNNVNALQREDSSTSAPNAAHLPRGNGNIQAAKDAFRLTQNMNDNTMMSETSDDGSFKLVTKDYTERNLPQELMSKMFGLLKEGMFCDAVVLAGDKEIRVHKMVLIAASPFLLSKMSKTTPSTSLRVELPTGIPLQVASQLVHYLYDGRVTLTTDNVAQFARVANLFKLEHLVNICEDFVNCFSLDQSLLTVLEEDIKVVATIPEEDQASPTKSSPTKQQLQKEETIKSNTAKEFLAVETAKCKKSKRKSIGKKLKEDLNPKELLEVTTPPSSLTKIKKKEETIETDLQQPKPAAVNATITPPTTTHKISHFYGTRAASRGKREDGIAKSEEQIVLVTSTTPAKRGGKKGKKSAKKDTKPYVMVKKGKMIMMYGDHENNAADNGNKSNSGNTDNHASSEEEELDLGKDGDPDWNMMIEDNPYGQTFMAYDHKKTGRQKRNPIAVPVKAEMPLRPPPKKRAREFTKNEEESVLEKFEDPNNIVINLSFSSNEIITKETIGSNKSNNKKKKINKPKTSVVSKKYLTTLVTNLESQAEHIPENERQYKCNLCGNEFVFARRSITHVLNTHEISSSEVLSFLTIRKFEKSPKVCDICGYETKDPNFYYIHYHKYFRHGVPLPKGWKPYTCDICGKECFTKFQLKDHKRVHTEGIPFICEVCGQGFKSRTCLNSHVFHKHNTIRKHECNECGKSFKTRTQLLVHGRIHSGEKPFHCPDCAYKSTTRGNMRLHLTNKHKFNEEAIKCMMYQIKTKSQETSNDDIPELIIDTPKSEANMKQESKVKKKKGKKQPETPAQHQISSDCNVFTQNNQEQLATGTVQGSYQSNQNVGDLLVNTGQQQVNYTTENIILQQYPGQQIIGEIQPGHSNLVQEVSDSSGTTTHVLLPAEHFSQGQHYVVQAHHTDGNTSIISPVGNPALGHDQRSIPQETHILCPQGLDSNEQIILSEQDQLALTSATRVQGQIYADRELTEDAQMLVADRSSITPLQDAMNLQTAEKVTELQNVPQQVLIDGSNQGVQIHIQTVQLQTDEHGQLIAHRDKNGKNYIIGDSCTPRQAVTLLHDGNVSEKGDNETILSANLHKQQQQHIGQMAISHEIIPGNFHQVVYSSSPTSHSTFVVNSQSNDTTNIETSGQIATPTSGQNNQSGQANPSPSQSPAALVNQGYTDAAIYQFYQQQYPTY